MLDKYRHVHFIGIGGSGISAIAYLALAHNLKVSGSDLSKNPTTDQLKKEGATIHIGHTKENLNDLAELVVYSEAIDKESNPEFLEAQKRGLETISYFKALGMITEHKKTIIITGTHGKTTTTAMLGEALIQAKMDPTVIVGSRVPAFKNHNIYIGKSKWLVVEGCEYRRSFLNLKPFGVVLLNCELEHPDYYKNEEDYVSAFQELAEKIPHDGFLVFNNEDNNAKKVSTFCHGTLIPVSRQTAKELELKLKVAGDFNQFNAAHAYKAAAFISDKTAAIKKGLEGFKGTARRMEVKGEKDGVMVIDDYGHHPTEIKVTLKAIKEKCPDRRLICVFQPHQYSRSHQLIDEFKKAFKDAEMVIVPDIFEARDSNEDKEKISAMSFAETVNQTHGNVIWGKSKEESLNLVKQTVKEGDILLTMGAGDVYKIGESFLKKS